MKNCKIAVLCCGDLSRAQYIYKYIELLDGLNYQYDVIYWNRSMEENSIECNGYFIPYNEALNSYLPFYKKIGAYLRFSFFVEHVIRKSKYDKIICLTTPMAICVIRSLLTRYKNKYLFDYRDLTKEYIGGFRKLVQYLAYNSNLFVVSSEGFLKYFERKKIRNYCICHNTLSWLESKKEVVLNKTGPIRIVYWGAIRQLEYNKCVCDYFGNHTEFSFTFHGEGGYKELQEYCRIKGYKNIQFTGKYYIDEISKFAEHTDILFCAYHKDFVTSPAMAVKVYDSIEYKIPLIVTKGTHMASYLEKYSYVKAMDIESTSTKEIYLWYKNLNVTRLNEEFDTIKKEINSEEKLFRKAIIKYLES